MPKPFGDSGTVARVRAARRRATIVDVAERAGVAISSASAALNGRPGVSSETRERIRQAALDLSYVPSMRGRSLSTKRTFSVGFIVERDYTVLEDDPFFSSFIGGIEEAIAPSDYALSLQVVADGAENLRRHLELADSRRVDGLILNELRSNDRRPAEFHERDVPVVGVNPGARFPFPAVRQDNTGAIRELADLLVSLGHRRLAHVSGPMDYVHGRERRSTWQRAVEATGVAESVIADGDFTHEGGVRAAEQLLSRADRPTAVFCANDLMAIGFMNRAMELGLRVPEDVSVAGLDGINLGSYVRPTLTTITTSPHALGRRAGAMLLHVIDGGDVDDEQIEASTLLVRDSTAAAPASTA
jgi:DNA-binding LacI/PurR family transcriptional regulator